MWCCSKKSPADIRHQTEVSTSDSTNASRGGVPFPQHNHPSRSVERVSKHNYVGRVMKSWRMSAQLWIKVIRPLSSLYWYSGGQPQFVIWRPARYRWRDRTLSEATVQRRSSSLLIHYMYWACLKTCINVQTNPNFVGPCICVLGSSIKCNIQRQLTWQPRSCTLQMIVHRCVTNDRR